MLKIGVISDTHWESFSHAYDGAQRLMHSVFADVDAIIHAGDMLHPEVDLAFAPYEFFAVRGNMDPACAHKPLKRIVSLAGVNIGVIHGWGGGAEIEVNAASEFDLEEIDVLIYGHSHYPACHVQEQVLFFNPGSAAERRHAPYHSVGLIRIGTLDSMRATEHERPMLQRSNKKQKNDEKERMQTWAVEARQVLQCGSQQQLIAEIINIDAVT